MYKNQYGYSVSNFFNSWNLKKPAVSIFFGITNDSESLTELGDFCYCLRLPARKFYDFSTMQIMNFENAKMLKYLLQNRKFFAEVSNWIEFFWLIVLQKYMFNFFNSSMINNFWKQCVHKNMNFGKIKKSVLQFLRFHKIKKKEPKKRTILCKLEMSWFLQKKNHPRNFLSFFH